MRLVVFSDTGIEYEEEIRFWGNDGVGGCIPTVAEPKPSHPIMAVKTEAVNVIIDTAATPLWKYFLEDFICEILYHKCDKYV